MTIDPVTYLFNSSMFKLLTLKNNNKKTPPLQNPPNPLSINNY